MKENLSRPNCWRKHQNSWKWDGVLCSEHFFFLKEKSYRFSKCQGFWIPAQSRDVAASMLPCFPFTHWRTASDIFSAVVNRNCGCVALFVFNPKYWPVRSSVSMDNVVRENLLYSDVYEAGRVSHGCSGSNFIYPPKPLNSSNSDPSQPWISFTLRQYAMR